MSKIIKIITAIFLLVTAKLAYAAELPGEIIIGIIAFVIFLLLLMSYLIFYGYLALKQNRFQSRTKIVIFNIINFLFFVFYLLLISEFWKDISITGFLFVIIPCLMQLNLSYKTLKLYTVSNSKTD